MVATSVVAVAGPKWDGCWDWDWDLIDEVLLLEGRRFCVLLLCRVMD